MVTWGDQVEIEVYEYGDEWAVYTTGTFEKIQVVRQQLAKMGCRTKQIDPYHLVVEKLPDNRALREKAESYISALDEAMHTDFDAVEIDENPEMDCWI